jgi:hypothetical protein
VYREKNPYNFRPELGITLEDLVKIAQDFYQEKGRSPKIADIKELHKQGRSPGHSTWNKLGGINWVLENAGLQVNKKCERRLPGDVEMIFRKFVQEFKHAAGRLPTAIECPDACKIDTDTFKKATGKSYGEFLEIMGAKIRRGTLAQQKAGPYK